jgi:zinc/manganese transport system substrate-binding protein
MKLIKYFLIFATLLSATVAQARLEIFSCEPEWASLVTELGGDAVNIFAATSGKQDPHYIEARPSLIAKTRRADLLVCTGAELESGWLPLLLKKSGNAKVQVGRPGHFMATDYVELLEKPQSVDRSQGDVHAAGNPHIHTSARNIALVAKALHQRLLEIDGENSAIYNRAYEDFNQRWQVAMARWEKQAEVIRRYAFAVDHKSWIYLAHWLDIDMSVVLEPKPGIPPTSRHLAALVKTVEQKNISKIVYAAYASPRAAQWLAEQTGASAVELPYTVSGNERANDLFELFDETLRLLTSP